jgi:beta-glucanase (GH16 family)
MRYSFLSAAVALAVAQLATAQTSTTCNPTKKTCPKDTALGTSINVDFTQGASSKFTELDGTSLKFGSDGAEFIINTETNAPTIESPWYIFFGRVEVVLKAAAGQGIVSSFVLQSDDLDEIDWEWLGGDLTQVQTNYFGKGDTTTYDRGMYHPVANPQTTFHTYAIDWTSDAVKWYIDGALVRTLTYSDAKSGTRFPQTPMRVKIGNWVGGSSTAPTGTVQWAGGLTDFSAAPFTMYVKSVTVKDSQTGAKSYTYGDLTGSWQSIKVDGSDGAQLNEVSSSSSGSPTSTSSSKSSTSSKASSSTTSSSSTASSSTTTGSASSTLATSTSSSANTTSAAVSSTGASTTGANTTSGSPASTTSSAASATSSTPSSAGKLGANFAMVMLAAIVTFFAL